MLEQLTKSEAWRNTVLTLVHGGTSSPWGNEDFATYWVVAGHHIRKQVADDQLLVKFLRQVLPPYNGPSRVLYRGENKGRYLAGNVGLCWSQDEGVACMFANGLNAVGSGGVVLRATFEPSAIISGPNAHSRYLGEAQYTVDPAACHGEEVVAAFPRDAG